MEAKPPPASPAAPAAAADPADVTVWLRQLGDASPGAPSQLFELLDDELRRMARNQLRRENPGHTLSGLEQMGPAPDRDLVAVHEALLAFEEVDKRAAKLVELRFLVALKTKRRPKPWA